MAKPNPIWCALVFFVSLLLALVVAALVVYVIGLVRKRQLQQSVQLQASTGTSGKGKHPSMLLFYAKWCGHCQKVKPIIQKLAQDNQVDLELVDGDERPETCSRYKIQGYPTLVFLVDGEEVRRHVGSASEEELQKQVESHCKLD